MMKLVMTTNGLLWVAEAAVGGEDTGERASLWDVLESPVPMDLAWGMESIGPYLFHIAKDDD